MKTAMTIALAALGLLAVLAAQLAAEAQQAGKVYKLGLLYAGSAGFDPEKNISDQAFALGLKEHGYVLGRNLSLELRAAEGKQERLPALMAELVRLKVDVIVTPGTLATVAAKGATTTIPIVMVSVGDPVGTGLIASLARPGGNITGLSDANVEMSAKRVELLKQTVPAASRMAIVLNPGHPPNAAQLRETQVAAKALGVELQSFEVRSPEDFETAFTAIGRARSQAVIILPDALTFAYQDRLAALAVKHRLPAIYSVRPFVEAGGLMAYGASFTDLFRRSAGYVDKILKGAKPADLPVEQPTKFDLVINLKTAKTLGLKIPQSLLMNADQVKE